MRRGRRVVLKGNASLILHVEPSWKFLNEVESRWNRSNDHQTTSGIINSTTTTTKMTFVQVALFSIVNVALILPCSSSVVTDYCSQLHATFNTTYKFQLKNNSSCTLIYSYEASKNSTTALRVFVSSDNPSSDFPVLFVVKQQLGILSWQIPLKLEFGSAYKNVARTLCPIRNYEETGGHVDPHQQVILDMSTASSTPVNSTVIVTQEEFLLHTNIDSVFKASPSQPKYFQASFPEDIDIMVVSLRSDDDICALVSLQHIGCPVSDLSKNIEYSGDYQQIDYQTMTKSSAFTVQKKDFKGGQFYVVLTVKPNDYDCFGIEKIQSSIRKNETRVKTFHVLMYNKITHENYLIATLGAAALFFLFYLFSVIVAIYYLIKNYRQLDDFQGLGDGNSADTMLTRNNSSPSYGAINQIQSPNNSVSQNRKLKTESAAFSDDRINDDKDEDEEDEDDEKDEHLESVNEDDIDMLHDIDYDKDVFRTKTFLYVSDLAKKDGKSLDRKTKMYLYNLFTVAVFYALPVAQLVITYESVLHATGNQDICYYNFLCTYPLGNITDFNHVFSNIGYICLGFLFISLVWRRDLLHRQKVAENDEYEKYYGIPRHYGLFYAMGFALMMEGVLSGCYHVCPNYSNFQFDTSFMYLIAALCMLKIYQTRHPDINASAYSSFVAFAVIVFIGVIGVVYGNEIFWIIFAVVHVLSCLALSAQIYYMGRWKLNLGIFKRIYLTMKTDLLSERHCCQLMYKDRFLLLTLVNLINIGFTVYGLIKKPRNFASFLLAIFIVNLLMYVGFYIILKIRSSEKILLLPRIYIALSVITWVAALYFFFQKASSWEKMPAESRTHNQKCLILDFYDVHDIWHFLSATSMFFSFMILLTLDDDLVQVKRDKIPVF